MQQRRKELGLTQEVAAERMGLHWTYLGQVERGRRNVSLHNIVRIAEGLEVDAGAMLRNLGELEDISSNR
ncbi:transcriptional regulator [Tsukamurella tyrosinosolvens]|nr:transcriptional regulator [Tsukamurella tyrosinosolvens]